MAKFSENYEVESNGGNEMSEMGILGAGSGFLGGIVLGGLAGYALNNWNGRNGNFGPVPYTPYPVYPQAVEGCGCNSYSLADVSNLTATKDAQYAQLSATQSSEFNILNTMSRDSAANARELCGLAYENATLNSQLQNQIAQASAKADLCCCQTQGMISRIVPELKQFYLEDEVAKLRNINAQQNTQCGFDKVNMNLNDIGCGVKAILAKLYSTTTTTPAA